MKTIKERFNRPLSDFKREPRMEIIGCAKRCLNNSEGERLLKDLIIEYGLDDPTGALDSTQLLYRTAQQDVIKHILALTNDT